jgi:multimeric flavodoxin WrbA
MKALVINCTRKPTPESSNTAELAGVLATALRDKGVEVSELRAVDHAIPANGASESRVGDQWPDIRARILDSEILVFATPTWLARPSSFARRVLERMNAMLAETDAEKRPVAYNRVAGVVVTGEGGGADHVISEVSGALGGIGFTIPGQAWTYWNGAPVPGGEETVENGAEEWSHSTGRAAASNLLAAARALQANPIPAPPTA